MQKIGIIGGGAAGMMAAIAAAQKGAQVIILEQKDQVGKKLLATGNGRCNFTNTLQNPDCYRSENPGFPWEVVCSFDMQRTVALFLQMGIYSRNRNGYLYPNSDQAASVRDALRMELERLHVEIRTETKCLEIIPKKRGFTLKTDCGNLKTDKVILTTGSKAALAAGADGSGYALAKQLGHRIIPVLPALVQLRCAEKYYKSLAGVRVQGSVELYADDVCLAGDTGEIQLTQYGISGIPVFQISRYAAQALREKKSVRAVLNFMPDFTEKQLFSFLKARADMRPEKALDDFFTGLFNRKLSELFVRLSKLDGSRKAGELTERELTLLCRLIQSFWTKVTGTNSYEQAQICCGGVATDEVNPLTMESLYVPGVFFAGEVLDVDGLCGGYNLQWAWSSGHLAGESAAKEIQTEERPEI